MNAIQSRQGIKHLRSLHARQQSEVVVEVSLTVPGDPAPWRYALQIEGGTKKKPMQIRSEIVEHDKERLLTRPNSDDHKDPQLRTQTHLEQKTQNGKFRSLVAALASIVHVHIVPQVAKSAIRAEELARRDAPGSDFIEHLAKLSDTKRQSALKRITKLLKHAVPNFSELDVTRDTAGRPHLEARYAHWRPQGGWQNEQDFSDGTLRLIGLFWAIDHGTGPLVIEEPELSLHPAVVRQLPRLLSKAASKTGRQFFVTTHSEEMLVDRGIAADEVVVLRPSKEDTVVVLGSNDPVIRPLAGTKTGIARAVGAATEPAGIEGLGLPGIA